jgi:hypothetical protein
MVAVSAMVVVVVGAGVVVGSEASAVAVGGADSVPAGPKTV